MTEPLMEYLPSKQDDHAARKYRDEVAAGYDAKREQSPKWQAEQRIVESMLDGLPPGAVVLDCPCGTGRFFAAYHRRGLAFNGIDISEDMLRIAATKVVDPTKVCLAVGDVRNLNQIADKSVDCALMIRLTRWLSPDDCRTALAELQRVAKQRIIFTARVRNHPHARGYDLIASALDGWAVTRDECGEDEDYRVLMLEPVK